MLFGGCVLRTISQKNKLCFPMKNDFNFIEFGEVNSTNDLAISRIAEGKAREGDVICAQWQTQGRGYAGNVWQSDPGKNLLCSFILQPHHVEPARQFILTQVISLAVIQVIQNRLPRELCRIKWPNDLYVNNLKIGGILFQNTIRGHVIDFAVAGLGINVNQLVFSHLIPNPVSLQQLTHTEISLPEFRLQLANSIAEYYRLTNSMSGIKSIENQYHAKLFRRGERAIYQVDNQLLEAVIEGVDEFGRLQVRTDDGVIRPYQFKEITFVI